MEAPRKMPATVVLMTGFGFTLLLFAQGPPDFRRPVRLARAAPEDAEDAVACSRRSNSSNNSTKTATNASMPPKEKRRASIWRTTRAPDVHQSSGRRDSARSKRFYVMIATEPVGEAQSD